MHVSPKLTAQVTLPKAAFSPSERYFQADLGEGATGCLLPGLRGGAGGCSELGSGERGVQGRGAEKKTELALECKSALKPHASLTIFKNAH